MKNKNIPLLIWTILSLIFFIIFLIGWFSFNLWVEIFIGLLVLGSVIGVMWSKKK